ncbi:RpoE-regulated lipoprotein [Erwinia sp. CGal63]|uniref:RpoE-regulated lipoprotein n=1 Tax=Erwinia sp. CGal63 TaxID=2919889 RepID=UPI00300BEF5F
MKTLRPFALAAAVLLAGCASSGASTPASGDATWWNPLTYSWSSLAPWNWFGSAIEVSEQGVGGLNGATAMNEQAIDKALNGDYKLRKGMRSENGGVVTFFQALDGKEIRLEVTGESTVSEVRVMDSGIKTASGVKIGTPFSDLYSRAFGSCKKVPGSDGVECKAPERHISYLFSGEWHGPEGLLPSDEALKKWAVSQIIWRR